MGSLIVEYKNGTDMYIVRISANKYYYGNGKDVNGIGMSANQFLRFNPYMAYVEPEHIAVPDTIKEWISENVG